MGLFSNLFKRKDHKVHDYHGSAIESVRGIDLNSERFTKTYEAVREIIIKRSSELYAIKINPNDDISTFYPRLRETAYPHGLKPIPARVWAKLPPNKRAYIIKTLPSCGRA
jgi:hypothetical protein